jgi:hypothetical protein
MPGFDKSGAAPMVVAANLQKALGSMEEGGKVKKTGYYKLHKDEKVTPAGENKMAKKSEHAAGALGKDKKGKKDSKKDKKKNVHRIHVRRSANGGYIAENEHAPVDGQEGQIGQTPPSEEHTYPDLAGLQGHIAEHMGPEEQEEQQEPSEEEKKEAMMAAQGGGGE